MGGNTDSVLNYILLGSTDNNISLVLNLNTPMRKNPTAKKKYPPPKKKPIGFSSLKYI